MKNTICLLFTFLLVQLAFAQKKLVDGWIVNNQGDTIKGQLVYKDWDENPKEIKFVSNKENTYTIDQLKAFGSAEVLYKRYALKYHLLPNNETAEIPLNEDTTATATIWLKVLVNQSIGLGVWQNDERSYFFYLLNNEATELEYFKGIKSFTDKKYEEDSRFGKSLLYDRALYKNQLYKLNALPEAKANIADNISKTDYNEYSLVSVFNALNKQQPQKMGKSYSKLMVAAGIGSYSHTTIGSSASNIFYQTNIQSNTTPYVAVMYESRRKLKNSLGLMESLALSTLNTTGQKNTILSDVAYEFKNTFLELNLTPVYHFNQGKTLKMYFGGGIDVLFKIGGTNTSKEQSSPTVVLITNDYPKQKTFVMTPIVVGGFYYHKIGGFLQYVTPTTATNYATSNWTFSRLTFGLNYKIN